MHVTGNVLTVVPYRMKFLKIDENTVDYGGLNFYKFLRLQKLFCACICEGALSQRGTVMCNICCLYWSCCYIPAIYRLKGYQGNVSEMSTEKTELGKQATARTWSISCNSNTTANKCEVFSTCGVYHVHTLNYHVGMWICKIISTKCSERAIYKM